MGIKRNILLRTSPKQNQRRVIQMELEKGMFVRTENGNIYKPDNQEVIDRACSENYMKIKKSSFNIIDLIEVGDYVNGYKVVNINRDPFIKNQTNLWTNQVDYEDFFQTYSVKKILENEIKEILTHEQYNANKYEVGE